jgi:hypothetical protein
MSSFFFNSFLPLFEGKKWQKPFCPYKAICFFSAVQKQPRLMNAILFTVFSILIFLAIITAIAE